MAVQAQCSAELLTNLLVILVAAKVAAGVFDRISQPAVVGEILAGVLIGPCVLGWVSPNKLTSSLADVRSGRDVAHRADGLDAPVVFPYALDYLNACRERSTGPEA